MNRDIDLGLAILSATTPPGTRRTLPEIAAYCNCSFGNIWKIENAALEKLRRRSMRDPVLADLIRDLLPNAFPGAECRTGSTECRR